MQVQPNWYLINWAFKIKPDFKPIQNNSIFTRNMTNTTDLTNTKNVIDIADVMDMTKLVEI